MPRSSIVSLSFTVVVQLFLILYRWRHNVDEASVTVKRMEANERNWISYERSYEDIESRLQELKVSVETVEDALGTKCLSHTSGSTTQRKLSKDKIRRYVSQLQVRVFRYLINFAYGIFFATKNRSLVNFID